MRNTKSAVVGAAVVMLVSSVIGATAVRTPDADAQAEPSAVLEESREHLATGSASVRVEEPVLTGGTEETLVLVVAAQVPATEAPARLAEVNARFGELQGFTVDAAEHYTLLGTYLRDGPDWLEVPCEDALGCTEDMTTVRELQPVRLVHVPLGEAGAAESAFALVPGQTLVLTGFRTKRGAEEFLELARAAGVEGLVVIRARKLGGGDIGLGQEPHPDGSGPLLGPLPDQEAHQW